LKNRMFSFPSVLVFFPLLSSGGWCMGRKTSISRTIWKQRDLRFARDNVGSSLVTYLWKDSTHKRKSTESKWQKNRTREKTNRTREQRISFFVCFSSFVALRYAKNTKHEIVSSSHAKPSAVVLQGDRLFLYLLLFFSFFFSRAALDFQSP